MATMINVNHWREKARIVEHALLAAYMNDLTPGTQIAYLRGMATVVVEIQRHALRRPGYCWVIEREEGAADRRYMLDCARIERIVAQPKRKPKRQRAK